LIKKQIRGGYLQTILRKLLARNESADLPSAGKEQKFQSERNAVVTIQEE
jgi:hypothetical protein